MPPRPGKTLFHLRDHPEHGLIRIANEGLERDPDYFERYGRVGSAKWWALYEHGRISRTELVGSIAYVGPNEEEPEAGEVVRIETDRGEIVYDRELHWADPAIQVGRWVHIEQCKTIVRTRTGPFETILDVRVWVEDD